ncbi:hypothetical protein [Aquipuribacter sp. SD81]|uniref:hypothetical protein n=1 Tax=Aquipuribacter sp. SD81 TaxID=3127703 RepID=UPI003017B56B
MGSTRTLLDRSTDVLDADEQLTPAGDRVRDVWAWAFSDNLDPTVRAVVAEYLVARAVGADLSRPRRDSDSWDVVTPDGTTVEVVSAARLDAGGRPRAGTVTWGRGRGGRAEEPQRSDFGAAARADVYVLCLQTATHREAVDLADRGQWQFHVLAREEVRHLGATIGLRTVEDRAPALAWDGLADAVRRAVTPAARARR